MTIFFYLCNKQLTATKIHHKRHIRKRYITKRHIRKRYITKDTSEKDTSQKTHQKKIHHITATYSRIALQKDMANKNVQSKYVQRSLTVYIQIEASLGWGEEALGSRQKGRNKSPTEGAASLVASIGIYIHIYIAYNTGYDNERITKKWLYIFYLHLNKYPFIKNIQRLFTWLKIWRVTKWNDLQKP